MTTLHLFDAAGRTDPQAVLEDREADYTPVPVALQGLMFAMRKVPRLHMVGDALDPSAGSGAFGRALRALLDERARIYGIEPRESEIAGLRAGGAYSNVCRAEFDASEIRRTLVDERGVKIELAASNPPFTAYEPATKAEPDKLPWWLDLRDRGCLHDRGVVLFLGLSQAMQGRDAYRMLQRWSPRWQLRCGGRPEFRVHGGYREVEIPPKKRRPGGPTHKKVKNGGDAREYSFWLWDMDYGHDMAEPAWTTVQMPVLPKAYRVWDEKAVPGTYPVESSLVAEIRERYLGGEAA